MLYIGLFLTRRCEASVVVGAIKDEWTWLGGVTLGGILAIGFGQDVGRAVLLLSLVMVCVVPVMYGMSNKMRRAGNEPGIYTCKSQ